MSTILAGRFDDALLFATHLHTGQTRKGTVIPYIAHLLAVASLVITHGGNEDEAIAGLLHDAVEDQGGRATLDVIRARFGNPVADIVEGCTDTDVVPKPPWRDRKERYLKHLASASLSIKLLPTSWTTCGRSSPIIGCMAQPSGSDSTPAWRTSDGSIGNV